MLPNNEQTKSFLRSAIIWLSGAASGYFITKGWLTAGQVEQITSVLTSEVVISALIGLVTTVIGFFVHSQKNAVAVVSAMTLDPNSPVKAVSLEKTPAGAEMAQAVLAVVPDAVITETGPSSWKPYQVDKWK